MKRCYTIGSIEDISNYYDVCQFTENSRVFPTSRRSAQRINILRQNGVTSKILVHQDFIYIASRYIMFNDSVKKAIIDYLKSYNGCDITGIIMHTDYPIKQDVFKFNDVKIGITDSYKASIWNKDAIIDAYNSGIIVEKSIVALANDMVNAGVLTRVFLENTTSTGRNSTPGSNGVASFPYLLDLFHKYPYLSNVFGLAYDTCHQYAVDGTWYPVDEIIAINKEICPVIVHLNAIPKEVTPGSYRDRHSFTTLEECSIHTLSYYKQYIESLDTAGILWVREIKQETIQRELDQLGNG